MASVKLWRDLFLLASTAGLLVAGVGIVVRGGRSARGRLAADLSSLAVGLVLFAAALAMVQHYIGVRPGMP